MSTINKFKWFWAWEDEKEEAWLGKMAREGWHLKKLGFPNKYKFESGDPRKDRYRMDFMADRKNYQNYLQLFQDAGWEHIGKLGGWQYFRTRKDRNDAPEIYTDTDSKIQKYQRLFSYLTIFFPVLFIFATRPIVETSWLANVYEIGKFFMGLLLGIWAYTIVMILSRIKQLKNK
ncbi:MAG TPA: DUF2812 domain-containing protein [Anaerolineales bacterium]|nr:DUF2812 domain-containing protein [Anaerolineales bacterium]